METEYPKKQWEKPKLIVIFSGDINEHVMVLNVSQDPPPPPPPPGG